MLTVTVEFVGVAYAILIGFVIVSLWEGQSNARETVSEEASALRGHRDGERGPPAPEGAGPGYGGAGVGRRARRSRSSTSTAGQPMAMPLPSRAPATTSDNQCAPR